MCSLAHAQKNVRARWKHKSGQLECVMAYKMGLGGGLVIWWIRIMCWRRWCVTPEIYAINYIYNLNLILRNKLRKYVNP